jgi:hypothetical protein
MQFSSLSYRHATNIETNALRGLGCLMRRLGFIRVTVLSGLMQERRLDGLALSGPGGQGMFVGT